MNVLQPSPDHRGLVKAAVDSPGDDVLVDLTKDNSKQLRPVTATSTCLQVDIIYCRYDNIKSLVKDYNLDKETAGLYGLTTCRPTCV